MPASFPPHLPPGRHVSLPGRGTLFVRELQGPPGAPTVVLLHGWLATGDLNWFPAFDELGRHFRVISVDHRGHGRGIASRERFSLAACAGDVAALVDRLGAGPVIAVGYSMGGPIAMLTWRDHPAAVSGIVLCATSAGFPAERRERIAYATLGVGLAVTPATLRKRMLSWLLEREARARPPEYRRWLLEETSRHRVRDLVEAGRELGRFDASPWIGGVDVPAASIIPTEDELVPPQRQRQLAAAIPGAAVTEIPGDHLVCVRDARRFVPALVGACLDVAGRARLRAA